MDVDDVVIVCLEDTEDGDDAPPDTEEFRIPRAVAAHLGAYTEGCTRIDVRPTCAAALTACLVVLERTIPHNLPASLGEWVPPPMDPHAALRTKTAAIHLTCATVVAMCDAALVRGPSDYSSG